MRSLRKGHSKLTTTHIFRYKSKSKDVFRFIFGHLDSLYSEELSMSNSFGSDTCKIPLFFY